MRVTDGLLFGAEMVALSGVFKGNKKKGFPRWFPGEYPCGSDLTPGRSIP